MATVVEELESVPVESRSALLRQLGDLDVHAAALREISALSQAETRQAPDGAALPSGPIRIAAWNAERGPYLDDAHRLLGGVAAHVNLLCELDVGMARTGQRNTPRELAAGLGHGYAYGVEFLELGLGNRHEAAALGEGVENHGGFHGAAVTAGAELRRPRVIRFDTTGVWFTTEREEPRVGGRMAIAATVPWGDRELVAACVHLESHGDPAGRADQMESLLAELDVYAESRPVVLGGDFNTLSAAAIDTYRSAFRERMVRDDPERFVDPVRYEPLFEVASARGYDWRAANAPGPTQRTKTSGYPKPPLMRIDWLFVRGVAASEPVTVPAVGRYGHAISDHDLIAVTAT